jgi:hypothetical protein
LKEGCIVTKEEAIAEPHPDAFVPGTFGCHEAMHEASIWAEWLSDFADHPAIALNPAWKAEADEIAQRMADLYQKIAAVHSEASGDERHNGESQGA